MATITSLGSGSGLDLEGLVTKLMSAENAPLTSLQNQEKSFNSRISALGSLKSNLSSLQTAAAGLIPSVGQTALTKFATYSANVADTTIATATATTGAVAGSFGLTVGTLAVAQGYQTSAPPAVQPALGDTLSFAFTSNGATRNKTITLDSSNSTLAGLRDAINNANMGVSATIVNGSNGAQLILKGQEGLANGFTLTGTGNLAGSGSATSVFAQTTAPVDAQITVNGVPTSSTTNTVTGIIDGVTLNLTKLGSTSITVNTDTTTNLTSGLNSFISAFNSANSLMSTQAAYNQQTKVAGPLQGNSTLRDTQSSLRNMLFGTKAGGSSVYQRMSDIGVGFATDGTLKLDSAKLNKALAADPNGVASLVAAVGNAYNTKLNNIIGSSGSIQTATDSANKILKRMTDQEAVLNTRLATIETQYRTKFAALDTLIAGMKSTSTYLTQQLASLTTSSSK